jgi:hypothetical protein
MTLTRQQLTQRATRLGPPVLTALEAAETVVEQIPTPFFAHGAIYRVSTRAPMRPRLYVLGVWGNDGLVLLNNNPAGYFELAANGGLNLASESHRVQYVTSFLESTSDFTSAIQILNRIEDAWWLPSPTPEESKRREEVIAKYTKVVEAPKLSPGSSTTVVVFLIRSRALVRLEAKLETSGRIQITESVLEAELPTVYIQ